MCYGNKREPAGTRAELQQALKVSCGNVSVFLVCVAAAAGGQPRPEVREAGTQERDAAAGAALCRLCCVLASDDHEAIAQVLASVAEQRAKHAQQQQQQPVSEASAAAVEVLQQQLEQVQLGAPAPGGAGEADSEAQQEVAGQQEAESCPAADAQSAVSDAAAAEGDPAAEGSSGGLLGQEASTASQPMGEDVVPREVQAEASSSSQAAAGGSSEAAVEAAVGNAAALPYGDEPPADQLLDGAEVSWGDGVGAVEETASEPAES